MSSADQDAWVEMARAIREQLRRQIPLIGAMKPDEQKTFVELAREALWLETQAAEFDHEIELRNQRLSCNG